MLHLQSASCSYTIAPASASYPSAGGSGSFAVTVNNGCAWSAISTNSWLQTSSAGSGSGTVTYTVEANTNAAPRSGVILVEGKVHSVNQAGIPVSLGVALGAPELDWETSPTYPWLATNPPAPTFDGLHSGMSGNRFVNDSASWVRTTVLGPGRLSFWWKVDSDVTPPPPDIPYSFDAFGFAIDEEVQDQIMGQVDWCHRSFSIPEGVHTLTWEYLKDPQYHWGEDRAWLDQVTYTTNAPPPLLETALDTCGVRWETGGDGRAAEWFSQAQVTQDGLWAAQSGAIYHNQTNWIQTVVTGVTNVSFWWKVSSQTNADILEFYTNSVLAKRISGEVNWQSNFFALSAGTTNVLKWLYRRDTLLSGGANCGWLDRVTFNPPPELAIASFATNLTLTASPSDCTASLPDFIATGLLSLAVPCSSLMATQTPAPGTILGIGPTHVVLTVASSQGSTLSVTNLTVVVDSHPPVLSLLGDNPLTNECHAAFVDPGVAAEDLCSGVASLTTNSAVNPNLPGLYFIEYVAMDGSGNGATNLRTVYVVDTTPPLLSLLETNRLTLAAGSNCTAVMPDLTSQLQVVDPCGGVLTVVQTPLAGTVLPMGLTPVELRADDGHGNTNTLNTGVTVEEASLPRIDSHPQSQTVSAGSPALFSVAATACSSISYLWWRQGHALPGETDAELRFTAVQPSDAGEYSVVVANRYGAVTSAVAWLEVSAVPPLISGAGIVPGAGFQLSFTGPSGQTYTVLAGETPGLPLESWTPLTQGTFGAAIEIFVDTASSNHPQRFYRIRSP
ncbi:MAG TPA: DUF5011 domain-containing protein [Candidatus Paceibacterota bacterium]|nr:DUF5011 domain-containing protein [Candidatus Paceibacterota bacterium]